MTLQTLLAVLVLTTSVTAVAQPRGRIQPYADYSAYVTTLRGGEKALAIATADPTGARCFAGATSRIERDTCQQFLQEKALVEALPIIAIAARAKLVLDADPEEPSRDAMIPIGQACADHADRLAETGIAPLRKIGPYTIGVLKSKLCNALLVAATAH
jgi:hypothetical protein